MVGSVWLVHILLEHWPGCGGEKTIGMNLNSVFTKASDYSKIQKRLTKELQVNSLEVLSSVGIMV